MNLLSHIPAWMKNKYLLTGTVFIVWLLFFDDRDILTNVQHHRELKALEASRNHYNELIKTTKTELEQLQHNPAVLEKYAREKYRMKKDNEDLFIVTN